MAFKNWWLANCVIFKLTLNLPVQRNRVRFFKQMIRPVLVNNFLDAAFNVFSAFLHNW